MADRSDHARRPRQIGRLGIYSIRNLDCAPEVWAIGLCPAGDRGPSEPPARDAGITCHQVWTAFRVVASPTTGWLPMML
jgi:hypothetical protein